MRSSRSAAVSTPFVLIPSTTPRTPRPLSVTATTTSTGFAVAEHGGGVRSSQEDDEEVTRADRQGVPCGEGLQAFLVPFDADEARAGRLAEGHAELHAGHGVHEGLMDVLRGLDEMRLAEADIQSIGILDRDEGDLDGHGQCIARIQ